MRGTAVVRLQEFVVAFRKVGRDGKDGVEFGSDDFLDFAVRCFGLRTERVSKTDGLLVGSWI